MRRAPQPQANDRRRRDTRGEARSQEQRPPSRREGSGGGRGPRDQDRSRSRENLELPPQDPVSIELGAAFKEAHQGLRDAIRALEKRKAEHGDEPAWLVEQLLAAEAHFTAAADAWTLHLEGTGRKPVARVR